MSDSHCHSEGDVMKSKALVVAFLSLIGFCPQERAAAQETIKFDIINADRKEVGQASIADGPNGVVVNLSLREKPAGIPPGVHGFHIHAVGKCEPPFKSAGDHFTPEKHGHGFLSKSGRHAGDMPNIHVPENGALTVEFFVPDVRLKTGKNALLDADGAALVIHAKPDDYRSDPSGNAGDRIACGIIESAKTARSK
jgi:Cu-Zn family superoxide dismutase